MPAVYRAAPLMLCRAPAKTFENEQNALDFARQSADDFRIGYSVYRVLAGRLKHLRTFRPAPARA
jgi:hypothetical protein